MTYPHKETPFDHKIDPLIEKRWSPMAFSDKPIEQEKIDSLFEALRWAPSSFNEQPWRIIFATKDNKEEFEKLAGLLNEGNSWAKEAYMLVLACAVPTFSKNQKNNPHHQYDTGAAMENLFLQAVSMNLIGHEMGGFDIEKAYEVLNIPKEITVIAMMAIGYPGDKNKLSEENLERQESSRKRKPISEVIFKGEFFNP